MLVCAECGEPIEDGRAVVERDENPADEDAKPELALCCEACAEREFGVAESGR